MRTMPGERLERPYSSAADRDGDFHGAVGDPDAFVAQTDDLGTVSLDPAQPIALREVLVHLVEEYARHCGHADLLRECLDRPVGQ